MTSLNRLRIPGAALLCHAALAAGAAGAVDATLRGFVSQRLEVQDDTGDDDDSALRAVTSAGATLLLQTPRTTWRLSPGVSFGVSEDTVDTDRLLPRFNGAMSHQATPRLSFNADAQVIPEFLDDAQFDDTGVGGDAFQITGRGSLGMAYLASPRDQLSASVFGRFRSFTEDVDDLEETRSFGVNGSWRRSLSALTGVSLSPSATIFEGEDDETRRTFALRAGADTALSERLSVNASLGPSFTTVSGGAEDEDAFSVVGGVGVAYDDQETQYSFSLNQFVDQGSDGALENRTSVGLSIAHRVNERQRLGFAASASTQTPLFDESGEDRVTLSLSPTYSHALTRDWSLTVGYRFRLADRSEDDEISIRNSVFLSISRGLSFLP